MRAKVSVIIPVYNQERYVRQCVESLLSQDYPDVEVIVVDDGSTDATAQILGGFGDRIRCVRQANRGAAAALNVGLRAVAGSLIGWLSADDLYLPGKIRAQVEKMTREPELALVYTDWIMINDEGHELRTVRVAYPPADQFTRTMLRDNPVNGSTVLMRAECFDTVGYFDETLRANVDGDMWFRLLRQGYRFGHIAQPLIKYRWHAGNLSHNYRLMQVCKDRVALRVIESFSMEQLFGDAVRCRGFSAREAYEELALTLAGDLSVGAAKAALDKASRAGGHSLGHSVLGFLLQVISTKPLLGILARVRQQRRWLLDRRLAGRPNLGRSSDIA